MVHANGWQSPFQGENLRVRIPSPSPTLKEKKMSEVCQCEGKDHTVEICIGEYKRVMIEANKWFTMLKKHCEHHVDSLCHIPLELYDRTGVIVCLGKNCPLVNEKE